MLVGDACHAVVPFLGQGMNAAFEDCTVLRECLAQHGSDRRAALAEYEALRKATRRRPGRPVRRQLHRDARPRRLAAVPCCGRSFAILLHRLFPRWYLPLYTMIEFTRIPYADAVRRARRQDRIVAWVASLAFVAGADVVALAMPFAAAC